MRNSTKTESFKKNDLKSYSISSTEQKDIKGGFLFRTLDNVRCEFDRFSRSYIGGNGDGDW